MTDNEKAVMTDCYRFLDKYNQPPPGKADEYWEQAGNDLNELGIKHRNHPLVLAVGPAIFDYLEQKHRAINRKKGM